MDPQNLAGFFITSLVCSYTLAVFASLTLECPFTALEKILLAGGDKRNNRKLPEKTEETINGTMNGKTISMCEIKTDIDQEAVVGDMGDIKEKVQQNGYHITYINSGFDSDHQSRNNLNDLSGTEVLTN